MTETVRKRSSRRMPPETIATIRERAAEGWRAWRIFRHLDGAWSYTAVNIQFKAWRAERERAAAGVQKQAGGLDDDALFTQLWRSPQVSRYEIGRRFGVGETAVYERAVRLGLGPKARPDTSARATPPPILADLLPVPVCLDGAREWLAEQMVREGVGRDRAVDLAQHTSPRLVIHACNLRRLKLGLSPYYLPNRGAAA